MNRALVISALLGGMAAAAAAGSARAETAVERGQYLVTIGICTGCHLPNFAGGRRTAGILSANITPDMETGIGAWTEAQFLDAVRHADARAMFAYLRTVPAVHTTFKRSPDARPTPPFAPPVTTVPDVPRTDKVAYGRYVGATVAHCMQCHTPRGRDGNPDLDRLGAGGNTYNTKDGKVSLSANITPAHADGIASWTDQQLKHAITRGVRPDGSRLSQVMDFELYEHMTAEDLDALVVYVRALKPAQPN